jgi:putative ABC transport system permease protein
LRLVPYHTRLALKSLRRDPGLSATIVIVMAVAGVIFSTAMMHYLRTYGPRPSLSAGLHQVEIEVADQILPRAFSGSSAAPSRLAPHTRVSFPNYRILASSGIPTRHTGTYRARLFVAPADGGPGGRARAGRFVDADFFPMFAQAFRWGGAWSNDDAAAGRRRVVIGRALNQQFFADGDSVGKTLMIDGRPYAVAGVLANDQPYAPEWDTAVSGGSQDGVYLPFAEHQRLLAWPETPLYLSPRGPHYRDLLASDAVFVSFWIELSTAADRQAYARFLEQRLGARGVSYQLRDLATWRHTFRFPSSAISFFTFLTLIIFAGGGVIMARLLMAKALVRGDELGVFRALGAPRRALFWRLIIEATILSVTAASLSTILAVPQSLFYNRVVGDTDIALHMSGLAVLLTFGTTLLVGISAALYPSWRLASRRPTLVLGRS